MWNFLPCSKITKLTNHDIIWLRIVFFEIEMIVVQLFFTKSSTHFAPFVFMFPILSDIGYLHILMVYCDEYKIKNFLFNAILGKKSSFRGNYCCSVLKEKYTSCIHLWFIYSSSSIETFSNLWTRIVSCEVWEWSLLKYLECKRVSCYCNYAKDRTQIYFVYF